MRRFIKLLVSTALLLVFFIGLYSFTAEATLKYKKETGKKCTFCHTDIPKAGDEDKKLTDDGRKYQENGFKLTDEQKKKPD
ncbi:MAG: hypothetical protein EHM61_05460 [Acidobacteria bacterium]|nr:MAG: hypothetical protein EHM61_05460 [Acidobacteriota bacterium]